MAKKKLTPIQEDLVVALDAWFSRKSHDFWNMARLLAAKEAAEFFQENMLTTPLYRNRARFHTGIFSKREIPGLILEFGVAGGKSLNRIAELNPRQTVYGFDSFEGLPEAWRADYQKGHFARRPPGVRENVELIIGWFNETLPDFVAAHPEDVSLLHIDCDLYSSTRTVFSYLGRQIRPGTVIVFDEYFNYPGWRNHEYKAFMEFVEERSVKFTYLAAVKSQPQVAVRVDSIA